MGQKECKVYEASLNGEVIARGFAAEVAHKIGVSKQSVIWCGSHDGTANGKYQVTTVGWAIKHYNKKGEYYYSDIKPIEEEFDRYEFLDRYGNTNINQREYANRKKLFEDKGYKVRYIKKKHGREKAYYIVEVINGL